MKNLFVILAVAGIFALASCGGGKKEDDGKAKQDSIDSVAKLKEDSIKHAEEIEQARLDSIAKAKEDSIAEAESNTGGSYYVPANNGGGNTNNNNTNTGDNTVTNPVRGGAVKSN